MKTTDWYTRTLLTLLVVLLGYVAAELRTLTYQQAALAGSVLAAGAGQPSGFGPRAVALRQPAPSLARPDEEGTINVRIVGYRYNNNNRELGDRYSSDARGLPVVSDK